MDRFVLHLHVPVPWILDPSSCAVVKLQCHTNRITPVTQILLHQQLFRYLTPIPLASTYGCTELLLTSLSGIVPGMIKYTKPQSFDPPAARSSSKTPLRPLLATIEYSDEKRN